MKKTTWVTIAGALGILGVGALMVTAGQDIATRIASGRIASTQEGGQAVRDVQVERFSEVKAVGFWDVDIVGGIEPGLRLSAPPDLIDEISVASQGETLTLKLESGRITSLMGRLRAQIVTPELAGIAITGGAKVRFSGIETERLSITVDGAGSITGQDSVLTDLHVEAAGATNIDLRESRVTNARVMLSGAGKIEITMAGGELSGELSGAGLLSYYGQVAGVDIKRSGVAKINDRTR